MIAAEVTEMRRAETDRMQLAALVQAAPDAIVARDRDGRIATWNPGAEQMFGLAGRGGDRPQLRRAGGPRGRARARRRRSSAEVNAGQTLTGALDRLRADGSRFPAQVSVAPLTLLDGTWHGTLAMIRDITDLVRGRGGAARARGAARSAPTPTSSASPTPPATTCRSRCTRSGSARAR